MHNTATIINQIDVETIQNNTNTTTTNTPEYYPFGKTGIRSPCNDGAMCVSVDNVCCNKVMGCF